MACLFCNSNARYLSKRSVEYKRKKLMRQTRMVPLRKLPEGYRFIMRTTNGDVEYRPFVPGDSIATNNWVKEIKEKESDITIAIRVKDGIITAFSGTVNVIVGKPCEIWKIANMPLKVAYEGLEKHAEGPRRKARMQSGD